MDAGVSQPWGGLSVVRVSGMSEDEPGGSAVFVLHGWGATGDGTSIRTPNRRTHLPINSGAGSPGYRLTKKSLIVKIR